MEIICAGLFVTRQFYVPIINLKLAHRRSAPQTENMKRNEILVTEPSM